MHIVFQFNTFSSKLLYIYIFKWWNNPSACYLSMQNCPKLFSFKSLLAELSLTFCCLSKLLLFIVVQSPSHVQAFATNEPHGLQLCQAPLSTGFPKQESWGGLPFPSPGDLPNLGIKSPVLISNFFIAEPPEKPSLSKFQVFKLVTIFKSKTKGKTQKDSL